jgi:F420-dependent oxidoreductase-like protein
LRFGLQHPNFTFDGTGEQVFTTLTERARTAEENGFDSFWLMDHLLQIPDVGKVDEPMLEGWTALSSLIGVTKRIRLGTMVTGNIYRNPALLAKMGATVDVLSGGRLFMGVGAGWFETEARAYGIPHYDVSGRLKRLAEALQIIRGMWTSDSFSFEGRFYTVSDALCVPKPVQKPHPPLMIGGSGERTLLRLVARYGDACNISGDPRIVRHKLSVLKQHCKELGTDYDAILRTRLGHVVIARDDQEARRMAEAEGFSGDSLNNYVVCGSPERVRRTIRELSDAGIQCMILNVYAPKEGQMLNLFIEEVVKSFS